MIYRNQLDSDSRCTDPKCRHGFHPVHIECSKHPRAGLKISYFDGALWCLCAKCKAPVGSFAIAHEPFSVVMGA